VEGLPDLGQEPESGIEEAPEGRILTVVHRRRERDGRLVDEAKRRALKRDGKLVCQACRFDFARSYGVAGAGIIECHHTRPLHTLAPGEITHVSDLALLCANCHRVVHASRPWLTLMQLRDAIASAVATLPSLSLDADAEPPPVQL